MSPKKSLFCLILLFSFNSGSCVDYAKQQANRKSKSIEKLKAKNIAFIDHLPMIEAENEVKIRSKQEIIDRAIASALIASYAEGMDVNKFHDFVAKYKIQGKFTAEEESFIREKKPTEKNKFKFVWRYEASWVLLWSLGFVDALSFPDKPCDVVRLIEAIDKRGFENFSRDAKIRTASEILDEADLIYRYHWATTEQRITPKTKTGGLNDDVVVERHHALNWLINYSDQDWDDVTTDT